MNKGRLSKVLCGGALGLYHMAYRTWGDLENPNTLVCVHGLTRNSLDYVRLANSLSTEYLVVAPDVVGRGESDYAVNPALYTPINYAADMITLLAHINREEVSWLGTSMGGIIGMLLASQKNSPILKLILDDVAPVMSADALRRIVTYVGAPYEFSSYQEASDYAKRVFRYFGLKTDEEWAELISHTFKPCEKGWRFDYDPNIKVPLEAALTDQDIDMWPVYNNIKAKTLLIRGGISDLVSADIAEQMSIRGPQAEVKIVPEVGHAPMFMDEFQISLVKDFLKK